MVVRREKAEIERGESRSDQSLTEQSVATSEQAQPARDQPDPSERCDDDATLVDRVLQEEADSEKKNQDSGTEHPGRRDRELHRHVLRTMLLTHDEPVPDFPENFAGRRFEIPGFLRRGFLFRRRFLRQWRRCRRLCRHRFEFRSLPRLRWRNDFRFLLHRFRHALGLLLHRYFFSRGLRFRTEFTPDRREFIFNSAETRSERHDGREDDDQQDNDCDRDEDQCFHLFTSLVPLQIIRNPLNRSNR